VMMCAMEPTSLEKKGRGVVVDGASFLFEAFRARNCGGEAREEGGGR